MDETACNTLNVEPALIGRTSSLMAAPTPPAETSDSKARLKAWSCRLHLSLQDSLASGRHSLDGSRALKLVLSLANS